MKKTKIFGAVLSASLIFAGCGNHETEAPKPKKERNEVVYTDEYIFQKYKIQFINADGEAYAVAKNGDVIIFDNKNRFKKGDHVQAVFDSINEKLLAVETAK